MSGLNLTPFMEQLTIQTKDLKIERLCLSDPFAWAQRALTREIERQYNAGLPVRIIVLKGRQVGISTASEGVLFNWTFIHPGTRSLVIAHETPASQNLFQMVKLMWEEWPFHDYYTESHNSQKTLGWRETRSSMSVATARNSGSGRSFTRHAVHCSECAFWEEPEELMVGLNQSVPNKPGTIVIIESTANGVGGWFHEEWTRATHRESQYVPMFFPWFRHYEYQIPNTTLKAKDLVKPERDLQAAHHLTLPQLAWRRRTIANECLGDENKFVQEYPCTPDEAFLSTGLNVFPQLKLLECFDERRGITGFLHRDGGTVSFTPDPTGPLTIFCYPADRSEWGKYVVAGDPSRTTFGDPACIQVINRRTFEQVAVWHGHIDPIPFADEIIMLGYYYNNALVNTEIDGPGYGTISRILTLGYPHVWRHRWADKAPGKLSQSYGWLMAYHRKHWAKSQVIDLLAKNRLTIHDRITYDQLSNYQVISASGELGPPTRHDHDDAVTSFMIAVCSTITEGPLDFPQDGADALVNDFDGGPPWEAFPTLERT